MFEELEKWDKLKQQVLPFDFWKEEEAAKQAEIDNLPYFPNPQTDNQVLFNLQKDYYKGNKGALTIMFEKLLYIAPRLINVEMHKANGKRNFTQEVINEMAIDATCLFVEQIKKNDLIITKSFVAYLRLQVLKVMNTITKAELFEKYCKKNHVNIFEMTEEEKKNIKTNFELEIRRNSMKEAEIWEMVNEAELLEKELPALSEREQLVERKVFCQKWYGFSLEEVLRMRG